jgi:hypothetical protein
MGIYNDIGTKLHIILFCHRSSVFLSLLKCGSLYVGVAAPCTVNFVPKLWNNYYRGSDIRLQHGVEAPRIVYAGKSMFEDSRY